MYLRSWYCNFKYLAFGVFCVLPACGNQEETEPATELSCISGLLKDLSRSELDRGSLKPPVRPRGVIFDPETLADQPLDGCTEKQRLSVEYTVYHLRKRAIYVRTRDKMTPDQVSKFIEDYPSDSELYAIYLNLKERQEQILTMRKSCQNCS
jgi:hypothetical protein